MATFCRELCKNGWADWDAAWDLDLDGPKEAYVRWGVHYRHLANTIEPSTRGGDAACCQTTSTTCWMLKCARAVCRRSSRRPVDSRSRRKAGLAGRSRSGPPSSNSSSSIRRHRRVCRNRNRKWNCCCYFRRVIYRTNIAIAEATRLIVSLQKSAVSVL